LWDNGAAVLKSWSWQRDALKSEARKPKPEGNPKSEVPKSTRRTPDPAGCAPALINTPLQRGGGVASGIKTVSTVSIIMPLKLVPRHKSPKLLSEASLPMVFHLIGDVI
jgi:hypothetical protein